MNPTVYYFTGSGNSLAVARMLARRLDASVKPMKDELLNGVDVPECLGLVFPAYNHRIPYLVKRFVDGLQRSDNAYVFAVCSYGDSPCIALTYLADQLRRRGLRLIAGFGVKMPYNYVRPHGLFSPFALKEPTEAEQKQCFAEAEQKVERIAESVRSRREGPIESTYLRLEHVLDALNLRETLQKKVWLSIGGFRGKTNLSCLESVQLMDHAFHADSSCVRCGTCLRVCPVGNIRMTQAGPEWLHRCEQCFACLNWCPKAALQFGKGTIGQACYHHPDVTLRDMARDA